MVIMPYYAQFTRLYIMLVIMLALYEQAWPLSHIETSIHARGPSYVEVSGPRAHVLSIKLIIIISPSSHGRQFLNDPECSLGNVCYICCAIITNKNENIFKMNKKVGMLLPKKELIQVE